MQKIVPYLWYDDKAVEAAERYVALFPDSRIKFKSRLEDTPSGSVDTATIDLAGQEFSMMSAGPLFKFTPAVSFLVACGTAEETDRMWRGLSEGGKELMPFGSYPFSERYGWTEDRYGLSWQVMLMGKHQARRKITPALMFTGERCGKAEEAVRFYASLFKDSKVGDILRYGANEGPDTENTVKHAAFTLEGQDFAAMDSAYEHGFGFNEAISFMVRCSSQEEIDYFWERLSAYPESEQCGWLKDKFGLSWQVVPEIMDKMMSGADPQAMARVTQSFLKMKKFDIAELTRAYEGR